MLSALFSGLRVARLSSPSPQYRPHGHHELAPTLSHAAPARIEWADALALVVPVPVDQAQDLSPTVTAHLSWAQALTLAVHVLEPAELQYRSAGVWWAQSDVVPLRNAYPGVALVRAQYHCELEANANGPERAYSAQAYNSRPVAQAKSRTARLPRVRIPRVRLPRVRLPRQLLPVVYFLVFVACTRLTTTAALLGLNYQAIAKSVQREKARRKKNGPLARDEVVAATERAGRLVSLLNKERFIWKFSRDSFVQVLDFPGPNHSAAHLKRMEAVVRSSTTTLAIAMHSFTLCSLTREVVGTHKQGVKARVIVDTVHMYGHGKQMRKLVETGVAVYTHEFPSYTAHDKYAIVDGLLIMEGSVNWSGNALIISGKITITDDIRHVHPLIAFFFDKAIMKCVVVSYEDVARFPKCMKCVKK